jgi:leader peptidase (prepilin peptidase) / N-methyltransferase
MIEGVIAFLAGLLIGSFLNVCIFRLPRDLSVVHPRSFCPACEKQIAWYDNIPLISFVLLRGRCRDCQEPIPIRYPLVELATGLLFSAAVLQWGVSLTALKYCLFGAIIVTLVSSDIEERILPDEFTIGGTLIGLIMSWFVPLNIAFAYLLLPNSKNIHVLSLCESALGAVVASGAIWLVGELFYRVRKLEGLGLGDVKMVAMIGAFLGVQGALLTLIVGSMLGGIGGLIYIFLTGKNASTYQLPFGAFLGASAMGIAIFGEVIVRWYLRMGS